MGFAVIAFGIRVSRVSLLLRALVKVSLQKADLRFFQNHRVS